MKENQGAFYVQLSPLSVSEIFSEYKVSIPRSLRIKALKTTIEMRVTEELKELKEKKLNSAASFSLKDGERLRRLEGFAHFSEIQFENAFKYYHNPSLNKAYYSLLWELITGHLTESNQQEALKAMKQLKVQETIVPVSVLDYDRVMNDFFIDEDQQVDGISKEDMKKHFEMTSNKNEVKQLADKYSILIPANTSKAFLRTKLTQVLKDKKKLNDELVTKINGATVPILKELIKELNLEVQDLLTISEMVEMIIEGIEKKRSAVEKPAIVIQEQKVVESPAGFNALMQQLLMNQQLILKNLEIFNEGIKTDTKKRKADKIFNYFIIVLIILVITLWAIYAIKTFLN